MITERRSLEGRLRAIGAQGLLDEGIDWEKLFNSSNPPGAVTPEVAQSSLTRQAIRDARARQSAARSNARIGHVRAMHQLLRAVA